MQNSRHHIPREADEFFLDEGCYILEILNREEQADLSISRARVEAGQATEPHQLRGMKEWYYILSGTGEMHLGTDVFAVGPEQVVAIPADTTQWIRNTGDEDLVFLCICTPRWKPEAYESEL